MSIFTEGFLFLLVAGVLQGTFALFPRFFRIQSEFFWSAFALLAFAVLPIGFTAFVFPQFLSVIFAVPTIDFVLPVAAGLVWGIGFLFFIRSIAGNGLSATFLIVFGISALFGEALPFLLYKIVLPPNIRAILIVAFAAMLSGVLLDTVILGKRLPSGKRAKRLLTVLVAGFLWSFLAMAVWLGTFITDYAKRFGASSVVAPLITWDIVLLSACTVVLLYNAYRMGGNTVWFPLRKPSTLFWIAAILASTVWVCGFVFYNTGLLSGAFANAFENRSVPLLAVVTATLYGMKLGEWKGHRKLLSGHGVSLVLFVFGLLLVGLATYLKK